MERDLRADLEKWAKIRYTPDRLQFADSIIEHAIERALKAEAELNDAWNTADLWKKKYEQAMDGIDDLQHHIDHLNFTIDDQKAKLAKMQGVVETMKAIGKDGMSAGLCVELLAKMEGAK